MSTRHLSLRPATGAFPSLLLAILLMVWPPLPAAAQDIITEVTVITGGSSSITAPAGYTKIPIDLNQGASGDYIYLCYRKGVGAPLTGLAVTYNSASPPAGYSWTRIDVDLNRGAGGAFVWLWYTKDPDCSEIDALSVQVNDSTFPAGYIGLPQDLNYDAGGVFLYLGYHKI